MSDDIPWTYSSAFKRFYVYLRDRDELVFQGGGRMPRPDIIDPGDLEEATYEGDLEDLSQSPPTDNAGYLTSGRTERLSRGEVPRSSKSYDPQSQLAAAVARARITPIPQGVLRPNPQNRDESIARIVVSTGAGPVLEPPLADIGSTAITGAEVYGYPTENLYPEYKPRKKDFFFVGKVFSILWSEPAGTTAQTVITGREDAVIHGPYGEPIFSKIRRFVVIRAADRYCNALPISTYGGRGVGKKGVTKSEHAIIYTNPKPISLPGERANRGEDPLRPIAIRVDPDTKADKLDPVSRVNFGHLHTIQHNVKVKSCGKVGQDSLRDLVTQFMNVFTLAGGSATRLAPASSTGPSRRPEPSSASTNRDSSDDKIQTALVKLMEGMSREDAVRKMIEKLEDSGLDRQAAADLIRKALS